MQRNNTAETAATTSPLQLRETPTRKDTSMPYATIDAPFVPLYEAEHSATQIRRSHDLHVPGPAQCEELTIALYEYDQQEQAEADDRAELPWTAMEAVARQSRRRQALLSDNLRSTTILLSEHLLRRRISAVHGTAVARAQLAFLRAAVKGTADWCDDRTVVRILPDSCRVIVPADFTIVRFLPGAEPGDFVYREADYRRHGAGNPQFESDTSSVANANATWLRLLNNAVPSDDDTARVLDDVDAQLR